MWSLIFIVISSPGWLGNGNTYSASTSHVDSFLSKKLCEEGGKKITENFTEVKVQYACVLEIN